MTTEVQTYASTTSLQPRDLGEAMTLSAQLAKSSIIPYALRNKPADVMVIMMYGMELGLSINQAMRGINVIKGRPSLSAELRVSKTRERGHRVGVVCADCGQWADAVAHQGIGHTGSHRFAADWTAEWCTVKAVRGDSGEAAIVTWTVEDAVNARLLAPDKDGKLIARSDKDEPLPWELYRKDMLYARAADRACKQIAPEVGYGLYTREEIEAMPADEPVRVSAEVGEPVTSDAIHRDAAAAREQAADQSPRGPAAAMRAQAGVVLHPAEPPVDGPGQVDTAGAVQAGYLPSGVDTEPAAEQAREASGRKFSRKRQDYMFALFGQLGFVGEENRDNRLSIISRIVRRQVTTSNDLTAEEGTLLIGALEAKVAEVETKDAQP